MKIFLKLIKEDGYFLDFYELVPIGHMTGKSSSIYCKRMTQLGT